MYAFPYTDFHATYKFSAALAALSADFYIEIHRSTINVDSNGYKFIYTSKYSMAITVLIITKLTLIQYTLWASHVVSFIATGEKV